MPRLQRPLTTISQSSWFMDPHGLLSVPWTLLPYPSGSPERSSPNGAPTRDGPYLESSKNTQSTTPQVPQWAPEARDARLQNFLHLSLKVPGKRPPPPPCSPSGSPWREKLHPQGQWLIHSFISVGVPNKEPSHKRRGKILGHRPRSPTWMEDLHTMGSGLVPQGDCLRHCNLYPSTMQLSARYLPPWLG